MPIPRSQLRLTDQELEELLTSERTLRVGTVSPDGAPHVVPLWFVWHGGAIWLNNLRRSRRTRDLQEGSPVALCVDTGHQYWDLRGAVLYGRPTEADPDDPALPTVRTTFGAKYFHGVDVPDVKSHQWMKVVPGKIVTWDFRKIPAGRDGRAVASRAAAPPDAGA